VIEYYQNGGRMGRKPSYEIKLTEEEKQELINITSKGKHSARVIKRAQVILDKAAGLEDEEISKRLHLTVRGIKQIRRNFYFERLESLQDKPRSGRPRIIDGDIEAHIIAIACSKAPAGHVKWTIRMLADRLVELEIVDSVSHVTILNTLKKMNLSLG
jgi:transposase